MIFAGPGVYYGCGWSIFDRDWANGRALTHSGRNTMNYAIAWLASNKDFAVIAATNQGSGNTFTIIDNSVGAPVTII